MSVQSVAMNYSAAQRNIPTLAHGQHSQPLSIATVLLSTEKGLMLIK